MVSQYLQSFIGIFFDILSLAVLARVLLSWVPTGGAANLRAFLHDVTEPVMAPFRRIIPRIGMIDISPIVVLIALDLVKSILLSLISSATI